MPLRRWRVSDYRRPNRHWTSPMGFGDEILAAGQAQRIYDTEHIRVSIRDTQDRLRWHPIWEGNPIIVRPTEPSGTISRALISAPYARPYLIDQPMTPDGGWKFNKDFRARDHLAKIYLTEGEWQLGVRAAAEFGPFILIEPYSKHPNLRWPLKHWEALVQSREDLTFIQHVHQHSKDYLIPGAVLIETSTFRDACGLLASADCYIRGESGMLHAAAALGVPSVAIWGGCMDWDVLGGYPLQVGVGIHQPACGRYYPCPHCAAIMENITPDAVSESIALAVRWTGKITLQ